MSRVYDGWHKIDLVDVEIKGKTVKREKLGLKSAVTALITDSKSRVALVKQFRPCPGETLYELPAGVIDKDKTDRDILLEELQEECNIPIEKVVFCVDEPIIKYYMVAGSSDATNSIYKLNLFGEGISQKVDDADVEEVVWVDIAEAIEMVNNGIIKDSKTIMGITSLAY